MLRLHNVQYRNNITIIIFMAEQSSRETEPNPAHTERVKSSREGNKSETDRAESIRERQSEIHKRETE